MEKTIHHSSQQPQLMKNTYHLTFREEVGNAVSHGVMMFLYLFALPFLSVYAYLQDGWIGVVGMGIYGICMIAMFGGSCLYHIMPYDTKWKLVFRKLDHISILLAIAGTYTPICLGIVDHYMLKIVLAVEWLLAIIGILLKSISKYAHPAISMILYMSMGWLAVLVLPIIIAQTGWNFVFYLLAGGLCYTIGAIFYAQKKPYCHFIWHLMIAAASLIFLWGILLYV
ncbi:hemolysin III family protein [Allobaculum stercoricanis]|uniref:PAQR family membrane homeostasis protein TrhA n=1 Tax=Allobaculum stercoricanis TaxID=174709 RepID=UPI0029434239|nr:hemolysin III family protein [Allobaculum stercoricanis]